MRNLDDVFSPAALCLLLGCMLTSGSINAHDGHQKAGDWVFTLGAGVLTTPNYTGDDANQLILAPSVRASDGAHWSIGFLEGVQYTVNPEQNWQWGLALAPSLGRDTDGKSPLRIVGDGTDDLVGLAETDTAVAARLFTRYKFNDWSLDAQVQQTFTDESQSLFSIGIRRSGRIRTMGPPLIVSGGLRLRIGNQSAINTLVGVSEAQAVSSGLTAYRPESGVVAAGLNGALILPLSRKLSILSTLSVERLGDELADSSLVDNRGNAVQVSGGLLINYQLGTPRKRQR